MGIGFVCIAGIVWVVVQVLIGDHDSVVLIGDNQPLIRSRWEWIDVVYALGYAKLLITIFKYMPQVHVNYKRQSTVGWSIWQILLDVAGGALSIMQLVIDSSLQNDWSGLTGNPVKLGLGNVSIFFDFIFMFQHYYIYRHAKVPSEDDDAGERRGLLASDNESSRPGDS